MRIVQSFIILYFNHFHAPIDHLKNNPSKIPFPKQTRSSWSNASFHKSPIYYLSRSKINTLITARSIHPYTKTTFLRAVDKVTHHQTISINNIH